MRRFDLETFSSFIKKKECFLRCGGKGVKTYFQYSYNVLLKNLNFPLPSPQDLRNVLKSESNYHIHITA